ncbi:MAG: hypothetical protein AAF798_02105 [Bacteroidota bacterium]
MKKTILLTLLLSVSWHLQAKVFHVTTNGTSNGSSWHKACSLLFALEKASPGDEIWVAKGKYLPTTSTDRTASFEISEGIKLYGGFVGTERSINDRNWEVNLTILSGEIGNAGPTDNVYSVVRTKNVSAATTVNGFVITGGFANGTTLKGDVKRCGGGWYNDGSNGASNPTIENCLFAENYARDGAALYNFAKNGESSPSITNCQFIANRADLDGGAIYNNGESGKSSPVISDCLFQDNEATYGAGIQNLGDYGQVTPLIENCIFVSNISYIRGSSIYSARPKRGICKPIIKACRYEDNQASVGKDIGGLSPTQASDDKAGKLFFVSSGY